MTTLKTPGAHTRPATTARRATLFALLAAALVAATSPAVTTRLYASDEVMYFVYLRSAWFDHDLSFENEYRHMYDAGIARTDGFRETLLERATATGRRLNFATIGCAIFWMPFYAVADAWVHVARWFGSDIPADGYSHPYIASVCYASALYGWLSLVLSSLVAFRVIGLATGRVRSLALALLVCLGTPLSFYMYVAPGFAHAVSAFAVSAFVLVWLRTRPAWSPSGSAALGALGALIVMVREQDALVLIGPAIDFAWTWRCRAAGQRAGGQRAAGHRRGRSDTGCERDAPVGLGPRLSSACAGIAGFGLTFLPQVFTYFALYGRFGPSPLLTRKMTWWSPHAIAVLFSTEHGLLFWTPLVALAVAGLVLLVAQPGAFIDPDREVRVAGRTGEIRLIGGCLMAMFVGHLYMTGCVASWTLAGAFGQRRFIALTPLFVVGLVALAWRWQSGKAKVALVAAFAACAWWNIGLMIQFGAGMMDRQRLDLARNARTTLLVLPRELPRLAYRYLFDRESFYSNEK